MFLNRNIGKFTVDFFEKALTELFKIFYHLGFPDSKAHV